MKLLQQMPLISVGFRCFSINATPPPVLAACPSWQVFGGLLTAVYGQSQLMAELIPAYSAAQGPL